MAKNRWLDVYVYESLFDKTKKIQISKQGCKYRANETLRCKNVQLRRINYFDDKPQNLVLFKFIECNHMKFLISNLL